MIKSRLAGGGIDRAVVIGGGAIGLEMAEALTDLWDVKTTLVGKNGAVVAAGVQQGYVSNH